MIERETWAEVILDYRRLFRWGVKREIEVPMPNTPLAVSIVGPRRAGKTFLMLQTMGELVGSGIPESRVVYINFEDPRLTDVTLDDLMVFLEVLNEMHPDDAGETRYFFLDEVQNVPGWERFVRYLLDFDNRVFVSGSSSKLLSKEIATQLRGRSISVGVFPFSFREFLKARGEKLPKYLSTEEKAKVTALLGEYLEWGGYPEAVLNPELRMEVLRSILDLAVYRDIVERWSIRNVSAIRLLLKMLARSSHLTLSKAYSTLKSLGVSVGKGTLADYMEYLSDAFILYRLPPYVKSYKKAELLGFKPYLVDSGLLRILGVTDRGRLLENTVFMELIRRGFTPGEDLFYFPSEGGEVDFIAGEEAIQVTYEIHPFNRERELKPLLKAANSCGARTLKVITFAQRETLGLKGRKIEIVPLLRWLL